MAMALRRFFLGRPLATAHVVHERLTKVKALAVFSSDALSSVAYATEEILLVLVLAGTAALHLSIPIAIAIGLLLLILTICYWQTVHAYPMGGGAYIVAKHNLGTYPSLVAGAALLTDYILTVAVSIASGVAAITSAFPSLYPHRVALAVALIAMITLANLRGIRESSNIFALPTYLFIIGMFGLIATGLIKYTLYGLGPAPVADPPVATHALTTFLVLRAFASGCTALTGLEAIADGVPAFQKPESRNAGVTLLWMALILMTMFIGITTLSHLYGIVPQHGQTVVSQLARHVLGSGPLYYYVQAATAMILVLAANTSYADFPRLASFIARDRFLPRQLVNLGDRLVFSNGIIALGVLASLLIIAFDGDTHALIPLYAVGVFLSFTLSQSGMVMHWRKERSAGWAHRAAINGLGAFMSFVVLGVFATVKFTQGAWIVIILIPLLVLHFRSIHRHYEFVNARLTLGGFERPTHIRHVVIVPVSDIHRGVVLALTYAKTISSDVRAVYVDLNIELARALRERWKQWHADIPLVVLESPYRSIIQPLLDYIDAVKRDEQLDMVTVLLPEYVTPHWWQTLLHNQTALLIKGALLFKKGVIVISVPYHLEE
ncbi:MAG: APC family permease [Acidobacteriota bacterium]|nr:APC family permease [Blastocatellia bacterium]MDW8239806.1 APC family permease [Acidobacteriota bacterium]